MAKEDKQKPAAVRIIRQLAVRYFQDTVSRSAAELAYYLLFALFPTLIFLNAALSLLHLSEESLPANLGAVLPPQVLEIISSYLSYIQGLDARVLLYACLVLAVYAISRAMVSLMRSVSRAYRIPRQGFLNSIIALIMAVAMMAVTVLLLVLLMVSENLLLQINQVVTVPPVLIQIWGVLRLTVAPLLMFGFRCGELRQIHLPAGPARCGSGSGELVRPDHRLFLLHEQFFPLFHSYGSLAAFMVLMLWLHLTGTVFIMGGELNHALAQAKRAAHPADELIIKEEHPNGP